MNERQETPAEQQNREYREFLERQAARRMPGPVLNAHIDRLSQTCSHCGRSAADGAMFSTYGPGRCDDC